MKVSSGTCTTVSKEVCDNIAENSGMDSDKKVQSLSQSNGYYPPGCYVKPTVNAIFFNSNTDGKATDCTGERNCLCVPLLGKC